MRLSNAVNWYLKELMLTATRGTVSVYESDLRRFLKICEPDNIAAFDAELCRQYLDAASSEGVKPATLQRKQAALSAFGKWGVRRKLWIVNPMDEVVRVPRPRHIPRPFHPDETQRLLALDLDSYERLVRGLLILTGLRVTSICQIKLGDINLQVPGASIRTLAKGRKVQVIQLHEQLRVLIADHLQLRPDAKSQDYLLETATGRAPRREAIEKLTHAWGLAASVPDCTPHRFRHSFATGLLQKGVDIRLISKALGHASLETTMVYTEVSNDMLANAIAKLTWDV
jgi:integrase/recombinase XerD